ncbi:MAG TPA: hypothetical protein VFP50_14430 [Anaeromyxobacteraceae bacterium]|nr:hypothetical protein [Anaeromyxobacteraceae bacterium]
MPSPHRSASPALRPQPRGHLARLALAAGLVALAGCASLRAVVSPPPSEPSERAGWLVYTVGGLRFDAPAAWGASGDARRLTLDAGGSTRLQAWVVEARFDDAKACLAAAEEALQKGEERLARVRRHPTTLARRAAIMQEADAGGGHGWAYAVCDGAVQYRLFFSGPSPIPAELLEAWRELVKSARLGS